ncbi:hypothetical protein SDC9_142108 [bioreactor metagenome]|uniref:Uncharacterized protein n=1 Tax=bioreactor metagenome TaxID=1076179 RepID=A0A645E0B1_9ZZZZ
MFGIWVGNQCRFVCFQVKQVTSVGIGNTHPGISGPPSVSGDAERTDNILFQGKFVELLGFGRVAIHVGPVSFFHAVIDGMIRRVPFLGIDSGIKMFRYRINTPGCQVHNKRLSVVTVGDLSFFDIQSDTVESFGCAVNQ